MNNKDKSASQSESKNYSVSDQKSDQLKTKVAESGTAYAYTQPAIIPSMKRSIAGITASKDVWQFAIQKELIPHLKTAVRLVRESFHQVGEISFSYEIDPEIENEDWITVNIEVSGSMEELLLEHSKYRKAIRHSVPISKLSLVRLSLGVE